MPGTRCRATSSAWLVGEEVGSSRHRSRPIGARNDRKESRVLTFLLQKAWSKLYVEKLIEVCAATVQASSCERSEEVAFSDVSGR